MLTEVVLKTFANRCHRLLIHIINVGTSSIINITKLCLSLLKRFNYTKYKFLHILIITFMFTL